MSHSSFRDRFHLPKGMIYLDGNSLGLLSRDAEDSLRDHVDQWRAQAIGGWTSGPSPWIDLAERIGGRVAAFVGADPADVVATGSTTSNLHQLLATLWDGSGAVLIDRGAFPSDRFAVESHVRLRGRDPKEVLRWVEPSSDGFLAESDIADRFSEVSVAVLPSVVYTSGQLLDMERLTAAARDAGTLLIWDCAHSVGVVPHEFVRWGVDAAFWCHYKWCNGGPGTVAGLFVGAHLRGRAPGLAGWFGGRKESMFAPHTEFDPAAGAWGLQIGTPPVLSLAALEGALRPLEEAGIAWIRERSLALTGALIDHLRPLCRVTALRIATPLEPRRRGGHVALRHPDAGALCAALRAKGVVPDHRRPDWIRLAPSPLTTELSEIELAVDALASVLREGTGGVLADSTLVP